MGAAAALVAGVRGERVILRPIERVYAPLADHLAGRGAAGERRVTLTVAAIEVLLGRPLPASARARWGYRSWWGGQKNLPHAWYGWQRVGWTVEAIDRAAETVTFARPEGAG